MRRSNACVATRLLFEWRARSLVFWSIFGVRCAFYFFLFGILLFLMEPVVTCICGQNSFCFSEFGCAQKALALFALLMSEGAGICFLHENWILF
jgi:hypothetical protein